MNMEEMMKQGMANMPPAMKKRHELMMNTPIRVYDPEVLLGSARALNLSERQVQALRVIAMTARRGSAAVLNEEQRRKIGPLMARKGVPLTMADVRQSMMRKMSSGKGMMGNSQGNGGMKRMEPLKKGGAGVPASPPESTVSPRRPRLTPGTALMLRRRLNLTSEQVDKLRAAAERTDRYTRTVLTPRQLEQLRSHRMRRMTDEPAPPAMGMGKKKDPPESVGKNQDPPKDPPAGRGMMDVSDDRGDSRSMMSEPDRDRMRDSMRDRYRDQYRDQLRDQYRDQFRDEYRDRLHDLYGDGLGERNPYGWDTYRYRYPFRGDDRLIDDDEGYGGDEGFGYDQGFGDDEGFGDDGGYGDDEGFGYNDGFGDDEGFGNDQGYEGDNGFGYDQGFGDEGYGYDQGLRGDEGFGNDQGLGGDEGFGGDQSVGGDEGFGARREDRSPGDR